MAADMTLLIPKSVPYDFGQIAIYYLQSKLRPSERK